MGQKVLGGPGSLVTETATGAVQAGVAGSDGSMELILAGQASLDNGNWRIALSGDDLVIQRRESASWVTKSTITAA